jgi:hypothetical protein
MSRRVPIRMHAQPEGVLMSQTGTAPGSSVVLVHGGSTDGSGWEGVYELLAFGVLIWLLQACVTRGVASPGHCSTRCHSPHVVT